MGKLRPDEKKLQEKLIKRYYHISIQLQQGDTNSEEVTEWVKKDINILAALNKTKQLSDDGYDKCIAIMEKFEEVFITIEADEDFDINNYTYEGK